MKTQTKKIVGYTFAALTFGLLSVGNVKPVSAAGLMDTLGSQMSNVTSEGSVKLATYSSLNYETFALYESKSQEQSYAAQSLNASNTQKKGEDTHSLAFVNYAKNDKKESEKAHVSEKKDEVKSVSVVANHDMDASHQIAHREASQKSEEHGVNASLQNEEHKESSYQVTNESRERRPMEEKKDDENCDRDTKSHESSKEDSDTESAHSEELLSAIH